MIYKLEVITYVCVQRVDDKGIDMLVELTVLVEDLRSMLVVRSGIYRII